MYPLRLSLWAKPAPHTLLVPSPGLLSWRWHNQHGLLIRRCQTWITFIAMTGRHWTQTSLKNIYWENCFKIYLSTEKKNSKSIETVILFLQNLSELPTCNPTASRDSQSPGAPRSISELCSLQTSTKGNKPPWNHQKCELQRGDCLCGMVQNEWVSHLHF